MKTLDEADVHYVKCLKPNYCQKPNCVDENFLSQQLRVNGIFDVMSAMMEKYPFRLGKKDPWNYILDDSHFKIFHIGIRELLWYGHAECS